MNPGPLLPWVAEELLKRKGDVEATHKKAWLPSGETLHLRVRTGRLSPLGCGEVTTKTKTHGFPRRNHTCKADSQSSQQGQPALHYLWMREDGRRMGRQSLGVFRKEGLGGGQKGKDYEDG